MENKEMIISGIKKILRITDCSEHLVLSFMAL